MISCNADTLTYNYLSCAGKEGEKSEEGAEQQ